MIEQDGAVVLLGEISSASSLTIMQVAERNKKVFFSTGARSDALRGKSCNRYSFHCDIPNTVMVNAVGTALNQKAMVKGKKFFTLTADYIFGHDLLKAAKTFFDANGANLIGDELIATDVTDFSPYLLKVRQAKPDVVCCNLAGNQVTNLVKQYAEFGFPYPLVGFNLNTGDAWAAGEGNLSGTWPTVWYHTLDNPASKAFVAAFTKKYDKPPENHAWIEYITLKLLAQAITETKSTESDALIAYFEKQTQFDIMKARKAHFRSWDHQLVQEAYPFTVKPKGEMKDKWDMLGAWGCRAGGGRSAGSDLPDQGAEPLRDEGIALRAQTSLASAAPALKSRRRSCPGYPYANRILAGTGGEWPRAGGLLPSDCAWPVADLQRRRRGQSGAWRVFRAGRVCLRRNYKISRLRSGHRAVPGRGSLAGHPVRAIHPAPFLHR